MKGITPVIAVILLLLITISLVGFAFIYFTRVTETAGGEIESQLEAQLNAQQQRVRVESFSGSQLAIRSIGTSAIPNTSIAIFINGTLNTSCVLPGTIAPGTVASCNLPTACIPDNQTVRVTAPGGSDTRTCG